MAKDIVFTLPAEAVTGASKVVLLGDFNNWNEEKGVTLEKQEHGSFKAVVPLEAGKTYQYRFLLNDGRWVNEYHAQNYVPVPGFYIDNCQITVPAASDAEQEQKPETGKSETDKKDTVKSEPIRPGTEDPETQNQGTAKAKTVKAKTEKGKTGKAATAKAATPKPEKKEVVKKKK